MIISCEFWRIMVGFKDILLIFKLPLNYLKYIFNELSLTFVIRCVVTK